MKKVVLIVAGLLISCHDTTSSSTTPESYATGGITVGGSKKKDVVSAPNGGTGLMDPKSKKNDLASSSRRPLESPVAVPVIGRDVWMDPLTEVILKNESTTIGGAGLLGSAGTKKQDVKSLDSSNTKSF